MSGELPGNKSVASRGTHIERFVDRWASWAGGELQEGRHARLSRCAVADSLDEGRTESRWRCHSRAGLRCARGRL